MGDYAPVTNPGPDQAARTFERMIGNSAAPESVLEQVERGAPTDSTVLIEEETGTGKELIAHAIHNTISVYEPDPQQREVCGHCEGQRFWNVRVQEGLLERVLPECEDLC